MGGRTWAGPRGRARCAEGGVTCRPPAGGGCGLGSMVEGGLPAAQVCGERLGAGQVHVPAGRKGRPCSWGRARVSAKPNKAGSWGSGRGAPR